MVPGRHGTPLLPGQGSMHPPWPHCASKELPCPHRAAEMPGITAVRDPGDSCCATRDPWHGAASREAHRTGLAVPWVMEQWQSGAPAPAGTAATAKVCLMEPAWPSPA